MNRHLRLLLMLVVTMLTTAAMAQVPISGTYTIQNKATGGYVQVKNKYYAKPDASASEASKIYVGVGVKNDKTLSTNEDGTFKVSNGKVDFVASEPENYRLYSLSTDKAADGSTNIECYNYLATAVGLARKVAARVVDSIYAKKDDGGAASVLAGYFDEPTFKAFVDSVITYYRDDYAYLTIQPVNAEGSLANAGESADVYARVTIPVMPEVCNGLYLYYVDRVHKAEESAGKEQTQFDADLWTYAKKFVLDRIHNKWGNDPTKKDFIGYVDRNFMKIKSGTTYYLTADQEGGGFGYCEAKDLAANQNYATWTMALTEPDAAAQLRQEVHIQNVASKLLVDVKGKYDAEPDYKLQQPCALIDANDEAHNRTHITVEMSNFRLQSMNPQADGTYGKENTKVDPNNYQISKLLSNDGQDVVEYMQKIRRRVVGYAYTEGLKLAQDSKSPVYHAAGVLYKYTGNTQEDEQELLANDIAMATDIVCQEYLKLKVRKDADNKYCLYFEFPAVPDAIADMMKVYKNDKDMTNDDAKTAFWNFVREKLEKVVAEVDAKDIEKVKRNLAKVDPGHTYFLTADDANTFDFVKDAKKSELTDKAYWSFSPVEEKTEFTANSEPIDGYFRIQSGAGVKDDANYVQVTDALWAAPNQTADQVKTEAGSVIYVKAVPVKGTNKYKVVNLRSQGIEVVGGEKRLSWETLKEDLKNNSGNYFPLVRRAINEGYVRWMRSLIELGLYQVASYLDENGGTDAKTSAELTKGFNEAVGEDMDLEMYMTPCTLADGTTKSYFLNLHTFKLDNVVAYVKKNQDAFDNAFTQMENVLNQHGIDPGTTIEPYEQEEMNREGYIITKDPELTDLESKKTSDGSYQLSYEYIFAHPQLLFYWLKLNCWKFMENEKYDQAIADISGVSQMKDIMADLRWVYRTSPGGNLFRRVHWDTDYFLINGQLADNLAEGDQYKNTGIFGGANNNLDKSYYQAETLSAGDGAKWVMKEVDGEDNYFGITANQALTGYKDGKYYTTTYLDFPIDVTKTQEANTDSELLFWNITSNVKDGTADDGSAYKYVEVAEVADVVPAGLPVVVESKNYTADANKLIPAAHDAKTTADESYLKGTFFCVGKSKYADETGANYYGKKIEDAINQIFGAGTTIDGTKMKKELANRYGIDLGDNDAKRIYTLNKNAKDSHNPMGFYPYFKKNNDGTISKWYELCGNKAFMLVDYDGTHTAKVYLGGFGDVTGISDIKAETEKKDGVLYDLQGRRVNTPHQGIYILNGKKILITK